MDKLFKTNKTNLLEIFKKSATLLKYDEIEYNEITNKFNYKKKGTGLQFGASAHICVELTEKDGITNANFSCNSVKGFPFLESGKQTILSKWYSECMTNSEKLLLANDLVNEKSVNSDEDKQTNKVLHVEKEIEMNQKKNKSKSPLILISFILLISMIFVIHLLRTHNYDSFQEFANDTSELQYYSDVENRFGSPSHDLNFSNYSYYTVIYKNIKVKQRGKKKNAFFKIDRQTDLIIGKGLD
jgi:hypothetical protein